MKLHVVSGFLGAGKTSAILALCRKLEAEGYSVALISNDQGRGLADTLRFASLGRSVSEIAGGCFCCRYSDLEHALQAAHGRAADVVLAEAVGSCADLVATVLSPLAERYKTPLEIAPLAVVVDPWRVSEIESGALGNDVRYLFEKQLQEADVVLLSRADTNPPDVRDRVSALAPHAALVSLSARAPSGLNEWLSARPERWARPLDIDYERYARAEAQLGWFNGRARIAFPEPAAPERIAALLRRVLEALAHAPVAHVKLVTVQPPGGVAALLRHGAEPDIDIRDIASSCERMTLVVNARVRLGPAELERLVTRAVGAAAHGAEVQWEQRECFQPAAPKPTHRYDFRCSGEAGCCASFYDRAAVRLLLGDSLHPGGVALSLRAAERLALGAESRVLDVACGRGVTLSAILQRWPVVAYGLDASSDPPEDERIAFTRGDAHQIPFETGSLDAVICECALSTFHDQRAALAEMRRVLLPGGRLALSDMVVEGPIPERLEPWVRAGTCLEGARSFQRYRELLEACGFTVIEAWNEKQALLELVARIRRNLLGAVLAERAGLLPEGERIDVRRARDLLNEARRAVDAGVLSYAVYVAAA